jgi:hypothetical protein
VGVPQHFDLFDTRRVQRKSSLYTNAMRGDPSHGKIGIRAAPPAHAQDGASHQLNPLPIALNDAVMNLYIITHPEIRKIRFQPKVLFLLL